MMLATTLCLSMFLTLFPGFHTADNYDYERCRNSTVADIVLLLDSSRSVGAQNWPILLDFVANFTKNYRLGRSGVRFAAISYSFAPVKLFNLITYWEHGCIEKALKKARFLNAQTMTDKAYNYIRNNGIFEEGAGGRQYAADFVVLFIQAGSSALNRTITAGQRLKNDSVRIIGVGIGPEAPVNELYPVVKDPQDVIVATGFDTLHEIERDIVRRICEGTATK